MVTVTSSAVLTGTIPCRSARHRRAGGRYARSGWWSGVAPQAVSRWPSSRGHLDLGADARVVPVDRRQHVVERGLAVERTPALVDVALELAPELGDVAGHRHRGGIAERAQAVAEDPVADVEQEIEFPLRGLAVLDLPQDRDHPARALAA